MYVKLLRILYSEKTFWNQTLQLFQRRRKETFHLKLEFHLILQVFLAWLTTKKQKKKNYVVEGNEERCYLPIFSKEQDWLLSSLPAEGQSLAILVSDQKKKDSFFSNRMETWYECMINKIFESDVRYEDEKIVCEACSI